MFKEGDVVQFNEKHKWCGSLGIITEVKEYGDDYRYMIEVSIPEQGTACIFSMQSNADVEYIGRAVLTKPKGEDE